MHLDKTPLDKLLIACRALFTSVGYFRDSFSTRAVRATVKNSVGLYSMPYYLAAAAHTLRGHRLNCAFKAIKNMRLARCSNLERLVIFITTGFTACHINFLRLWDLIRQLDKIVMHRLCHPKLNQYHLGLIHT
jgi:hypothetical protein